MPDYDEPLMEDLCNCEHTYGVHYYVDGLMCSSDGCACRGFLLKVVTSPGYVTKDSGKRQEYPSGMRRDTQEGKPRFELTLADDMPYSEQLWTRFAALMARGAEKYGDKNWQLADSREELDRFKGSALRHLMQWFNGEIDEDHAAATVYNLMAGEYVKWKMSQQILGDSSIDPDPCTDSAS